MSAHTQRPGLESTLLYSEDLVLIAPKSLGPVRSVTNLQGLTLFMWPTGCPYRLALEQWLSRHDQAASIISIASYGTIIGCVSAGNGAALVPRGIYEQYRQGANWQGHEFAELTRIDNLFYWHANAGCHPARDAFSALLQGHCLHGVTSNEA